MIEFPDGFFELFVSVVVGPMLTIMQQILGIVDTLVNAASGDVPT